MSRRLIEPIDTLEDKMDRLVFALIKEYGDEVLSGGLAIKLVDMLTPSIERLVEKGLIRVITPDDELT